MQVLLAVVTFLLVASDSRLVASLSGCALFGCSILSAVLFHQYALMVMALFLAMASVARSFANPSIEPWWRKTFAFVAVVDAVLGVTLLARRDDAVSLTVRGLYDAAYAAGDMSAACSLAASCGYGAKDGLPIVPLFTTHDMRFGVSLSQA